MKHLCRIWAILLVVLMLCAALPALAAMENGIAPEELLEIVSEAVDPEVDEIENLSLDEPLEEALAKYADFVLEEEGNAEAQVSASDDEDFVISNGVLKSYLGDGGDVVIPAGVTSIGSDAFGSCKNLMSVTIPDSVTIIGSRAFSFCTSLKSITIPESVTSIANAAFSDCISLTSVTIPESVTFIGGVAFGWCKNLASVTVLSKELSIASNSFTDCPNLSLSIVCDSTAVSQINDYVLERTKLIHTPVTDPAIAPTYAKKGKTEGSHCSACGKVFLQQKDVPTKTLPENSLLMTGDTSVNLNVGDDPQQIVPDEGKAISYAINTTGIVKVSDDGKVTALKEGITSITVTLTTGEKLWLTVNVTDPAHLSETFATLDVGSSVTLVVNETGGRKVTWSSDNQKIATVKNGKVVAIKAGTCTISANIVNGKTLKCKVTTIDPAVLSQTTAKLNVGESINLKVSDLAGRTVMWSASNRRIATVKNGKVVAVKAGTCTIIAKVANGKTLKCKVTIKDPARLSKTTTKLNVGKTVTLNINNAEGRKVTWTSSNQKIATVKNGKVTAVKAGTCTIKAKFKNGKMLKCKVAVKDPGAISEKSITLSKDAIKTLKLTGLAKRGVDWTTSDASVVSITNSTSAAATVKGGKKGSAVITAKIENGKTLQCKVTVTDPLIITVREISDTSIYNEVYLDFQNYSGKKIVYIKFNMTQYNNRGDRLKSPYSYYYFNDTIGAYDTEENWEYWVHDDTKRVSIQITEVTFSDGSRWKP